MIATSHSTDPADTAHGTKLKARIVETHSNTKEKPAKHQNVQYPFDESQSSTNTPEL